ncbi:Signal recognition particle receptor beta subunit [Paragonimus heterotremus]|uniref:Signal recognition particle receptor subunit beta n=1 Tax=Paragonimus heterotremus TaxID=100268 RepID=A0A8J4SI03_9TREM|nr:Signal recognition particle receptor beta subunit [Paragonimus heterotremus]
MLQNVALSVVVAVLLCVVTAVIFWILKKQKGHSVLLLGICEAGKTSLFTKLIHNTDIVSYTSLKENCGAYKTEKRVFVTFPNHLQSLNIIDIPGHEKVRYECFRKYRNDLRALIFMIDSKNIQTELKDVAEFMYNVLTDPQIAYGRHKVLIVCNKQDCTLAKGSVVIRSLLEKELNTLTLTRVGALAGLDPRSGSTPVFLTKPGSTFTFATTRIPVDFVECCVKTDIASVEQWLKTI